MNFEIPPGLKALLALFLGVGLIAVGFTSCQPGELNPAGPFKRPVQKKLSYQKPLSMIGDYEVWGTHSYEIEALIMSRKRYWFDREAKLSPVDFLLGWGPVTRDPYVSEVKWSQSARWGHYRYPGDAAVSPKTINRNTANTHIVPSPDYPWVKKELLRLKRGDAVRLSGYLIKVHGEDGYRWESSTTRNDTGDGACEVFYVEYMERIEPVARDSG